MKTHVLKCWPESFRAIVRGEKRYEIRRNDRGFIVGDTLILKEWVPEKQQHTGEALTVHVTYMTHGGAWGLPDELCVMSIEPLEPASPTTTEATCPASDTSGTYGTLRCALFAGHSGLHRDFKGRPMLGTPVSSHPTEEKH